MSIHEYVLNEIELESNTKSYNLIISQNSKINLETQINSYMSNSLMCFIPSLMCFIPSLMCLITSLRG